MLFRKDGALLRPGRLDRLIFVGPPDVVGRAEVLRIRMRRMQVAPDVDIDKLAKMVRNCSLLHTSARVLIVGLDGRLLGCGAWRALPGGSSVHNEKRYGCATCPCASSPVTEVA